MASPATLPTPATSKPSPTPASAPAPASTSITIPAAAPRQSFRREPLRRHFLSLSAACLLPSVIPSAALADNDEEYVKETEEVIKKVRSTLNMDKSDPNVAEAVAELREVSNSWVAKYRKEKALIGKASFRDIYSALNAVSGHYISFGPTTPIPAKRKTRILEEMDTAEKALSRGR